MEMNKDVLISKVFFRNVIWDKRLKANRNLVDKAWQEIAVEMGVEDCLVDSEMEQCKLLGPEKSALASMGYEVRDMISEGTYSLVYNGEFAPPKTVPHMQNTFPKDIPVRLALKVMEMESQPKGFVERMLPRELTIHSRISHPHIIPLHSILQVGTKVILATRLAERGTLLNQLMKYGELREKQARQWFRQLCVALSYLHKIKVAHRDIKCENILITCNNNVKLCDFGFARGCTDSKGVKVYSRTHCGSLAYAAPELVMGVVYEPTIADMWSIGVVLYAMLNGCLPFNTERLTSLLKQQLCGEYRFRKKVQMRISTEACQLVSRLLEPNWPKRLTAKEALASSWIAVDPKLVAFTQVEEAALQDLDNFNLRNKIKITKLKDKTESEAVIVDEKLGTNEQEEQEGIVDAE